jgi:dsDNA-specific endonuclease/ATPase MutS2
MGGEQKAASPPFFFLNSEGTKKNRYFHPMNKGHSFAVGDYVGILEGTEKGYIIKIEKNKAWIETENGFEITSLLTKLVKYKTPKKNHSSSQQKNPPVSKQTQEEFPKHKKPIIKKVKDENFTVDPVLLGEEKLKYTGKNKESVWEVDLHIEEIVDRHKHLTNGEIVDLQLRHARSVIEKARKNKIQKLIFIHGKGKGTLRMELLSLLAGYSFLEYYDASFKTYGGGATEVRIFISKI